MQTALRLRRPPRPSPQAMTLSEHLRELRLRLLIVMAAFVAAAVVAAAAYSQILHVLQAPYCHVTAHCQLYVTGPLDGLSLRVKIAMFGGLVLSSPVILWQLWRFITPGLLPKEKRYLVPFLVASILLFGGGITLAYLTFPHALQFLGSVGGPSLHQIYDPVSYLGLILALMTAFGIAFEFPVVLVALELAGVVSPSTLAHHRRIAIVLIAVLAAVITPSGDPFSMGALALPLYTFFEISIVLGKLFERKARAPLQVTD
jgi:sec-independent protein translocase protein TatC